MNHRSDAGLADLPGQGEQPDAEVRLQRRVKAGVAVAVVLTGLLGLLSWRMARQAAADTDWVSHTYQVQAGLELTLRHLVEVETEHAVLL